MEQEAIYVIYAASSKRGKGVFWFKITTGFE
jgi:hypothetical protein